MTFHGVVYDEQQISAYLSRINFPSSVTRPSPDNVASKYGLEFLTRLGRYHTSAVPFENLNLHYTKAVVKSLDPKDLYEKIVNRRWGGTCTESNQFFQIVLRSLGYKIRPLGGRVFRSIAGDTSGGYYGWNHCICMAFFDKKKYLVDVAMGPTCATQPLLLEDGHTAPGIGLTTCRIRWDTIPDYMDPESKLWIYEQNADGKSDFVPTFCFSELEFLPSDYEIMKAGTTFCRTIWFTWRIVCTKVILSGDEEPVGMLILANNSLIKRIKGQTEPVAKFSCEAERVEALEKWFGIQMTGDELKGIRGSVTYLGDPPTMF